MVELPQDIWELIARYLPKQDIFCFISLNRALLNIALDERYRTVAWLDPDEKLVKLLRRLE
jgi:hypothetical protein